MHTNDTHSSASHAADRGDAGRQPIYRAGVTQLDDVPGLQLLRFERPLTDEEHAAFLADSAAQIEGALHGGATKTVMIIDANNATRGTSLQRKAQAEWQERFSDYFRDYVICGIFMANSAIVRGALRAVGWLKPFPYPHEVVSSIDQAIILGCTKLQQAGEARPAEEDLARLRALY